MVDSTTASAAAPTVVPLPGNPIANIIDQFLSTLVTVGVDGAEAYLAVQLPFLEGPYISWFTNFLVSQLGSYFTTNADKLIAVFVNDVLVNGEESTVVTTMQALVAAQKSGSANDIATATAAAIAAYKSLGKFDTA